jgi:hypothetical protein
MRAVRLRLWTALLLTAALTACDSPAADRSAPSAGAASSAGASAAAGGASAGAPAGSAAATTAPAGRPSASAPTASRPIPTPGRSIRTEGVTLVRSGGIAGLTDTITVRPDGVWQRSDKQGRKDDGKLAAARRTELQQLLADPRLAAEAQRPPGGGEQCRDALTYLLVSPQGLVRHTQCPGAKPPEVTMRIAALLLAATGA